MSSGPQIVVDAGMYKVGYKNGSDGATSLCHVGIFSGACFDFRRSLLIFLLTRQDMPLTEQLELRGDLCFYSASTLFFGGGRSRSGELLEDNSSFAATSLSPCRIGSLPLFCLTRGAGWLLPHAFSPRSSSKRARRRSFSYCR